MSKPLRDLADVYYGKSPNEVVSDESAIPIIGTGGVYGRATRAMYQGPAVVVPRKGSLGNPQFIGEPFWPADTTYAVLPKPKVDAKWLYYSLAAFDLTKLNEATGVPSINRDLLYRIKLGSDEFDGQRRIAEILSTLDEAIEQTEALIAKYQQIKAGLMHDLFTRGVTPDGHLRPTRAQALHLYKESSLGWIPKEWEATSAEILLARIIDYRGKTPTKTVAGIPLITAKNVRMGYIDPGPREFIAENDYPYWMTRGIPNVGDVLFTTEAPLGNVAQIETRERIAFAQRVIILQAGPKMRSSFLRFALMSEHTQRAVSRLASGTTALGIKQSEFRKVLLPHPLEMKEQELIEGKLQAVDGYLHAQEQVMSKLRQQKHGLMHDLLTGRVRVKVGESQELPA